MKNLLAIAEAYAKGKGVSLSHVSKAFYGDGSFFDDLKAGKRSVGVEKLGQMVEQFRRDWPEGVAWPSVRAGLMTRRAPEVRS